MKLFRDPIVDGVVLFLIMTFGRAAPSAASSLQKRGPRRPPRTGRRGRLPTFLAHPRRDSLLLRVPSMSFVNADLTRSIMISVECRVRLDPLAVVARGGFPPIAMVRLGMAMAMQGTAGDVLGAAGTIEWLESGRRAGPRRGCNSS